MALLKSGRAWQTSINQPNPRIYWKQHTFSLFRRNSTPWKSVFPLPRFHNFVNRGRCDICSSLSNDAEDISSTCMENKVLPSFSHSLLCGQQNFRSWGRDYLFIISTPAFHDVELFWSPPSWTEEISPCFQIEVSRFPRTNPQLPTKYVCFLLTHKYFEEKGGERFRRPRQLTRGLLSCFLWTQRVGMSGLRRLRMWECWH